MSDELRKRLAKMGKADLVNYGVATFEAKDKLASELRDAQQIAGKLKGERDAFEDDLERERVHSDTLRQEHLVLANAVADLGKATEDAQRAKDRLAASRGSAFSLAAQAQVKAHDPHRFVAGFSPETDSWTGKWVRR